MATVNVTDFGARGDGSEDTAALQSAVDAASPGDTVYIPGGSYVVETGRNNEAIDLHTGNAQDLTIQGDGRETVLRLADYQTGTSNSFIFQIDCRDDVEGLVIRNMVLDGNRQNQSNGTFGVNCYPGGAENVDVVLEHLWVHDHAEIGLGLQSHGVTVDRCTTWNCDRHGINVDNNYTPTSDPVTRVRNSYSYANGNHGCDVSDGSAIVENCVFEANAYGIKNTGNTHACEWRRCRIVDNNAWGWRLTSSGSKVGRRHAIGFADCVFEDNGEHGIVGGPDLDISVPDGSDLLFRGNNTDSGAAALHINTDANFDGSGAAIWAVDNAATGLASATDGAVTIGEYHHTGNDGGGLSSTRNLAIDAQDRDRIADLPNVPTADDVGAGTGKSSPSTAVIRTGSGVIRSGEGGFVTR